MEYYTFCYDAQISLLKEFAQGFTSISFDKAQHGRPINLYLSHDDGSGVLIRCAMHDVDTRFEVGSLVFKRTDHKMSAMHTIGLPDCFRKCGQLNKLVYSDKNRFVVESGLVFTVPSGEEIIVMPGVVPYTVELFVTRVFEGDFDPEYSLDEYERVLFL